MSEPYTSGRTNIAMPSSRTSTSRINGLFGTTSRGSRTARGSVDYDGFLKKLGANHPLYGTINSFFNTLRSGGGTSPPAPNTPIPQWQYQPSPFDQAPPPAPNNPWLNVPQSQGWMNHPSASQWGGGSQQ